MVSAKLREVMRIMRRRNPNIPRVMASVCWEIFFMRIYLDFPKIIKYSLCYEGLSPGIVFSGHLFEFFMNILNTIICGKKNLTLLRFISGNETRLVIITLVLIVGIEIADISISKIYLFNREEFPVGFALTAIAYVVGQYVILKYVSKVTNNIRKFGKLHFAMIHKITKIVQYVLVAILLCIILQMYVSSYYSTRLLVTSIWVSYVLAISLLVVLVLRFFYWFRSNRNSVVLLYGLSSVSIAAAAAISLLLSTLLLIGQPVDTYQIIGNESPSIPDNLVPLQYAYFVVSILSFIITWGATALMLRHHSVRFGIIKYWIIVSIPLLYFLMQFLPFFVYIFSSYSLANPALFSTIYTVVFSASKPGGGLLFAVAFWSLAKRISDKQLRSYMIIAGCGLALIFGSEQAVTLATRTYPPFGLATTSFFGLASYLVLIGIYSSALSVAEDSKLRRSIKTFALKESRLLDSIGTAQMEQEIQKRVLSVTRKTQELMTEETGIQSSLSEDDMRNYLEQVIREVKTQKTTTRKTNDGKP